MDYRKYTVEDFVLDSRFRKWVLQPDKETHLFWDSWVEKHPEKVPLLKEARVLLLHLPQVKHALSEEAIDELWYAIDHQMEESTSPIVPGQKVIPLHAIAVLERYTHVKERKWDYHSIGRVAATVLIVLSFCLSYFLANQEVVVLPTLVKKESLWGQRSTIFLSDGTKVNLNAGSSITYYKDFTENERVVTLHGEAFFSVAKDAKKPFRVFTGDLMTQALGTSFNVWAYDPDQVKVALVTGKVSVDNIGKDRDKQSTILSPGEEAHYQLEKGISVNSFDPKRVLSWKEGVIYFRDADEISVFNTLEQWYGVKIQRINHSKKVWDYTASFHGQSLEHVLMSVGYAMDFEFEINQKSVVIHYK